MHMKDEFRLRNLLLWLPQQLVDEKNNFFPNSGASNDITFHLSNLLIHSEYRGCEQVVFGNSSSLMILNIGSTSLKHNSSNFHLQNILHCPNVLANLLICINFHKILIVILYSHLMIFCQVSQDGKYVFPRQEWKWSLYIPSNFAPINRVSLENGLLVMFGTYGKGICLFQ